jgi:rhodanese-related sulfurtransferase
MKKSALICLSLVVSLAAPPVSGAPDESYPLRARFPKVKYITIESLNRSFNNVIIVDVRSDLEYNVIHINGSRHVPIANANFSAEVKALRAGDPASPIAFYCNGHQCAKSYEAAELAMALGIGRVIAYDSGIHDWVQSFPDKTTLMGVTPAPKNKLIAKEKFQRRKIKFAEFVRKSKEENAVVIDIREPFQRKEIPDFPNLRNIPVDRLVKVLEGNAEFKDKTLLITDAVGKQVEWLQYYLEKYGYTNFYFLENGVLSALAAKAAKGE